MKKPFWEQTYQDKSVSTFSKGPTVDLKEYAYLLNPRSLVLDVGCGEGRNSIFLAAQNHIVEAFDLSKAGIEKAKGIAGEMNLNIKFWSQNLAAFEFEKEYDVILSHGVLHLPEKVYRDKFISEAQKNTKVGGFHFIGIFTNRLPATPDNAPFTKSLFDVGELPEKYSEWEIIHHLEGTFSDEHPGGIKHEHAFERIIAKKL
ncbi:MAG: methyltransferase domain-containing protein [Oscillospiraceae bacterium]|nr:methyltransferase domain-containing protein [Oscillospiraceae bacterium]